MTPIEEHPTLHKVNITIAAPVNAVGMAEDMKINPERAKQLAENISSITSRITTASKGGRQVPHPSRSITYVSTVPRHG
jgi:hypothetical protein